MPGREPLKWSTDTGPKKPLVRTPPAAREPSAPFDFSDLTNWFTTDLPNAFIDPFRPAAESAGSIGEAGTIPEALGRTGKTGYDVLKGVQDLFITNPGNYLESQIPTGGTLQGFGENVLQGLGLGPQQPEQIDALTGPSFVPGPQGQGPQMPQAGWQPPGLPGAPDLQGQVNSAFGIPPLAPTSPNAPGEQDYINSILYGLGSGGPLPNGPHQLGSLLFQLGGGALAGALAKTNEYQGQLDQYNKDSQAYIAALSKFESDRGQSLADAQQTEFQNQILMNNQLYRQRELELSAQRKDGPDTASLSSLASLDPQKMFDALSAVDPQLVMEVAQGMGTDLATLSGAGLGTDLTKTLAAGKVLQLLREDAKNNPDTAQVLAVAEAYARAAALANGRR